MQPASGRTITIDGGIAGTLVLPSAPAPAAAVLMLHGFGASRDEVGSMFAAAAGILAICGIASLRIDFRGFGDSAGDEADTTLDGQVADAAAALAWLRGSEGVDGTRLGLLGFSLGGAVALRLAAQEPGSVRALATWSSVGDPVADFAGVVGREAFAAAAQAGIVTLDLGWRTITLRSAFFESLAACPPLAEAAAGFPGALLMVAGRRDFSAAYPRRFARAVSGRRRGAWIVRGADHVFGVLGPGGGSAPEVIAGTAEWFADTLRPALRE